MLSLTSCATVPVNAISKDCVGDFAINLTMEEIDKMELAKLRPLALRILEHDDGYDADCS